MRPVAAPLVALLLLMPAAAATHASPADVMGVRPLHGAHWLDGGGVEHVGVRGAGQAFMTVEDVSTLAHGDLAGCHGEGYTQVAGPVPAIEGPSAGNSPFAGHGTWTAGVVCATGEASVGHYPGLAPGAKVLFVAGLLGDGAQRDELYRQMIERHRPMALFASTIVDPREQVQPLADGADILIAWAAGNQGGDGLQPLAEDPGDDGRFLVVAATTWDGADVAAYSSRGDRRDPSTWPDIAAVGCHVVPVPRHQPGMVPPYGLGGASEGCREISQDEELAMLAQSYVQVAGTSFAAPSVAAVAVLMREVHPGLSVADARALLLGTAAPFLPTQDQDGDGDVTRHDFWLQHGFAAGHGRLDATAAVAAAHFLGLHPGLGVAEALRCAAAVQRDGSLWLNPDPCPVAAPPRPGREPPVATGPPPHARNESADGAAAPLAAASGGATQAPLPALLAAVALAVALLGRRHHR